MKMKRIISILLIFTMIAVSMPLRRVYAATKITYEVTGSNIAYDRNRLEVSASFLGENITFTISPGNILASQVTLKI